MGRCTLCRRAIESLDEKRVCGCGSRLHEECYQGHRSWCARWGVDRWVGTQEL